MKKTMDMRVTQDYCADWRKSKSGARFWGWWWMVDCPHLCLYNDPSGKCCVCIGEQNTTAGTCGICEMSLTGGTHA
jgi:hypothetical protein